MKTQLNQTLLVALLAVGSTAYAQVDTSARPASAGTTPTVMGSSSVTRPTGGGESKATDKNLADNLAGASDFSTLQTALVASGLADQAKGPGPYTVFAPSNAAFSKLPAGALQSLTQAANKNKLAGILAYHVVSGNVMASDLKDGQKLKTVGGGTLTVRKEGKAVMLTDAKGGSAMVTTADIQATNGTVHAIDSVLMPN
ncbi:fasciclin domain-containing protein [Fibrella forsythiae]|uniref:Fasciclin domain-containing protein n=1 Tax=Fibrella forsythiae TaxID=2817061 RepID=A0ABS3JGW4_9BACT|nr:fasciclin domain-containing protein [Fibrella forsythiae]MBO0948643.1 fasciclin domain-containing protein [Fibrella forsythiae]